MAFDSSGFYISSVGFSETKNKLICYISDDSIATILAANYFPTDMLINIGDVMTVVNGDTYPTWIYATAISPQITTAELPATAIPALTISTAMLQALCVTDAKINDVNGSKIVAASIPAGSFVASAVTNADLATGIDGIKILPASIPTGSFSAGSIATADVAALAITDDKLATGIDGTKITAASIPAGSFVAGAITNGDFGAASITPSDLASSINIIKAREQFTTTAAAVSQAFTLPGVVTGDYVFSSMYTNIAAVTILSTKSTNTDEVTVTWSGAPQATDSIQIFNVTS
jgi:hypothetical protein